MKDKKENLIRELKTTLLVLETEDAMPHNTAGRLMDLMEAVIWYLFDDKVKGK